MSELTTYQQPTTTALTIADEQHQFTEMQVQGLRHIGVEGASQGDLAVFFHVVKRTGLDPFARQIYMIGRRTKQGDQWVTKQTIQTGIDGYRLIGRRAAAAAGHSIRVDAAEWLHETGEWRPAWTKAWGQPLAARVTLWREGEPFTAVANFDEYVQTSRNGEPNSMWRQRPAGQIAKCAEALAWRMAFPQDLSDIYTDDEMAHADAVDPAPAPVAPGRAALAAAVAPRTEPAPPTADDDHAPGPEPVTPAQVTAIYAGMNELGYGREAAKTVVSSMVGREVTSMKDLTRDEASTVLDAIAERRNSQTADDMTPRPDGNAQP